MQKAKPHSIYLSLHVAISTMLAILLLVALLVSCRSISLDSSHSYIEKSLPPHLLQTINAKIPVQEAVLHSNGQVYLQSTHGIVIVDEKNIAVELSPPLYTPSGRMRLSDIAINLQTGLAYSLDKYGDAVHIISETQIITSITVGIQRPNIIVADQDSHDVYVFYTDDYIPEEPERERSRAVVLSETKIVTDIVLPAFPSAVSYNPVDGYIYVAGLRNEPDGIRSNTLFAINNHQVITTINPLDSNPELVVEDLAINPTAGDVHVLLSTKVVHWNRVDKPSSFDFKLAGYKNPTCITVDPIREIVYVCIWMDKSYALAIANNRLESVIPIADYPYVIERDEKHDYVYIAHYDPTNLSVIRNTGLITTLNIVGAGTMDLIVDEENNLIYTANADGRTISIFGFEK